MNTFFESIISSIGWFGIALIILTITLILARKYLPKMRFRPRDIVIFGLVIGCIYAVVWAISGLRFVGPWIKETTDAIATSIESRWWTVLLSIAAIVIIVDLFVPRKKKPGEEKMGLVERWDKWKHKFYFAILWSVVILILNLFLSHLEIEGWQDLWNYKGTGSWFFSLIMILLVASMVLIVNVKMIELRWCGGILFLFAMSAWMYVAFTTDSKAIERQKLMAQREHSATLELEQKIRSGDKVTIPKGSGPQRFIWREIAGLSAVPMYIRFNEEGEFKLIQPGTVGKGPLHNLDPRITVVEIKSPDYDIDVYYKTD